MGKWPTKPIGELCDLINGRAFKPAEWEMEGLPIVRIQNLNDHSKPFNRFPGHYTKKHYIDDGEILLSWSGTPGTSFGCFRWLRGPGLLNQHIFKVIVAEDLMDGDFFIHAVNSRLEEMIGQAHGGVGLRHITKSKLEAIHLPVPKIDEQRRIVARIKECMERVEEIEGLRAEAAEEAGAIYPSRCHDFFATETQIEGCQSVSIGDLAISIQYGYTQSATKNPVGPQFLRITDIQNHTVNWGTVPYCEANAKQTAKYKLAANDILFTRTGATTGKSFLIENDPPLSVFASYLIRLQIDQEKVLPRLVYHFFQSPLYWDQIRQNMRGGAQPNINSKVLAGIKLSIPTDLDAQQDIVDRLDEAFSISMELQDSQQTQRAAIGFMRESILRKAFAGEL